MYNALSNVNADEQFIRKYSIFISNSSEILLQLFVKVMTSIFLNISRINIVNLSLYIAIVVLVVLMHYITDCTVHLQKLKCMLCTRHYWHLCSCWTSTALHKWSERSSQKRMHDCRWPQCHPHSTAQKTVPFPFVMFYCTIGFFERFASNNLFLEIRFAGKFCPTNCY